MYRKSASHRQFVPINPEPKPEFGRGFVYSVWVRAPRQKRGNLIIFRLCEVGFNIARAQTWWLNLSVWSERDSERAQRLQPSRQLTYDGTSQKTRRHFLIKKLRRLIAAERNCALSIWRYIILFCQLVGMLGTRLNFSHKDLSKLTSGSGVDRRSWVGYCGSENTRVTASPDEDDLFSASTAATDWDWTSIMLNVADDVAGNKL